MILSWKRVPQWMFMSLSALLLILLLTACGGGGSSNTATPTPVPPTPTPTPTPTQAAQLQNYTGTGFTVQYPQDWKTQTIQGGVMFTDAQKLNSFSVVAVPNPGGAIGADQELKVGLIGIEKTLGVTNVQPASLPPTATVGGETWVQSGITGSVTQSGVTVPGELVGLAVNHPANSPTTQTYEIYYAGPSLSFQQENLLVFQPMLQTFKFTA